MPQQAYGNTWYAESELNDFGISDTWVRLWRSQQWGVRGLPYSDPHTELFTLNSVISPVSRRWMLEKTDSYRRRTLHPTFAQYFVTWQQPQEHEVIPELIAEGFAEHADEILSEESLRRMLGDLYSIRKRLLVNATFYTLDEINELKKIHRDAQIEGVRSLERYLRKKNTDPEEIERIVAERKREIGLL